MPCQNYSEVIDSGLRGVSGIACIARVGDSGSGESERIELSEIVVRDMAGERLRVTAMSSSMFNMDGEPEMTAPWCLSVARSS